MLGNVFEHIMQGPRNDLKSGGAKVIRDVNTNRGVSEGGIPPQPLENFGFCERVLRDLEHTFDEFGLKIQLNARLYNTMLL